TRWGWGCIRAASWDASFVTSSARSTRWSRRLPTRSCWWWRDGSYRSSGPDDGAPRRLLPDAPRRGQPALGERAAVVPVGGRRAAPALRGPGRAEPVVAAAGGAVVRLADLDGGGGARPPVRATRRGTGVGLSRGARPTGGRGCDRAGRLVRAGAGVAPRGRS